MRFVLYSYPECASHVIRMALEELELPYRDEMVDMRVGAQSSPDFLALNPRGLVPVLAEPSTGLSLAETGAILTFLTEMTGQLAPPLTDPKARADFHHMMHFLSNGLHGDAQLQYYTARYVGGALADPARPVIKDRMRRHFAMLEVRLAAQPGPWLLGEHLSVCDFYLGGCARWSQIAPRHDPLEPDAILRHPHLRALLERLERLPSAMRAFDTEETPRSAYFTAPVRSRFWQKQGSGVGP